MNIERRQKPRYPVIEEIVVLGSQSNTVAKVHDIGAGGLQVQYLPAGGGERWSRVDVVAADSNQVLMRDVCCRTVYDIPDLVERGTFSGMNVRLCGLSFAALSPDQQNALQRLLECFANCSEGIR